MGNRSGWLTVAARLGAGCAAAVTLLVTSAALADSVGPASFPRNTYFLGSVACHGTTCEAVGAQGEDDGAVLVRFVNGRAVSDTLLPSVKFGLYSVACPASGLCYAVGGNGLGGVVVTIRNGVPGTPVQIPGTPDETAIGCGSASACVAVDDSYFTAITNGVPGAARFVPGGNSYQSVSCPSASRCVAVGYTESLAGIFTTITGGVPAAGPKPIPGASSVFSVSCPTTTHCEAVGGFETTPGVAAAISGIASITNGVAKRAHRVPGGGLAGVACQNAGRCEAVGSTVEIPIINGTAAKAAPVSGDQTILHGIACYTATRCLAVGQTVRGGRQVGVDLTITVKAPSVHEHH